MRAIWSGAIGFGLVNIPVKLFSAIQESELDLDMLDKKDFANIRFKRVNANTGREVEWAQIVKGYKMDDRYVVLSPEDFEKASPEKNKLITISEFTDEDEIDSIYFETPYYLQPDKSGVKAYALLRDALKKTKKVGLGSFVLRNRESLVIIKPLKNIIVLNKIRFSEEIRDPGEIKIPAGKSTPAEMTMAVKLISQLSSEFNIERYKDTYTASLMKLIKAKAKGKKIAPAPLRVVHSSTRDLVSQLKASLQSSSKRKAS
jgi:DNA end-binding protein Ku